VVVQKLFESVKPKDELTTWCETVLRGVETSVDCQFYSSVFSHYTQFELLTVFTNVSTLCLRKKRTNFETVYLEIIRIDFDDIWQKYSKDSRIEFACFSFHAGLLFLSTFGLSNRTPKITHILTLYQARAPTLMRCSFFYIKRIPKFTIFGTHNLQTFTHNTLILTHSVVLASFHFYSTSSECCTSYSRIVCLSDHSSVTHWHCVSMTEATVYDYAHVNPAADVSVAVPSLIWQLTLCRH